MKFPDQRKEQRNHCLRVFSMSEMLVSGAGDGMPDFAQLRKVVKEEERDKVNQAKKALVKIIGDLDEIDLSFAKHKDDMKETEKLVSDFGRNGKEFRRHTDLCLETFAPKS